MGWIDIYWSLDDNKNFGFPFMTNADLSSKASLNESKSVWFRKESSNFGLYYNFKTGLSDIVDISKNKTLWIFNQKVNFGFPFITTTEQIPEPDPEPLPIAKVVYKLYYNNDLIYRSDFPINGLNIVDGELNLKKNASGSLTFSLISEHPMYDRINRMTGLVKVEKNDKLIWEGRVLSEDIDFWGTKEFYCEGILSCLNDTRHPQLVYKDMTLRQYMEALLSIHNQKVNEDKKFKIGIVTVNDNADIGTRTTSYESTWELFKKLVDEYGGYLFIRYENNTRYIDFRKDCPRTSSQKIEFGVNLIDFTRSYDMSSLCTVLLPLGKTIASAGSNTVGDVIDSRLAGGHYIDPTDYDIYYDANLGEAYKGSNTYFPVEAGKTYYISCRNHDGRVMWALKDSSGNLVDYYTARSGDGFTDLIEHKLEVPPSDVGNNYQLAIAGFGADIQPRVNSSIDADESFDKYTTVEEINDGSLYVSNEEAVTNYGWIEKQLTWSNIDDATELKKVAEAYLKDGQFDEMSITLTAIDLQMMGINADSIDILDEVWVVSKPHGLNKTFPVTELTIKLCDPTANEFTLGSKTEQTLSGVMADANDEIFAKLNSVPSQSATLKSAQENATMLINTLTSGIFSLEYDTSVLDDGHATGFRISNVADWNADGAKGWRFTMGGLGYFGNGFNNPVTLALTGEDGGIVANCITTGQLLSLDIRGGTIGLGHWLMDDGTYRDGQLQLADSNGNIIVDMNQNGAYINGVINSTGEHSGGGPQTVHIENGWIYGSDLNAGHISCDTNIYGVKSISIDGRRLAINMSDYIVVGDSNGNLYGAVDGSISLCGNTGHTVTIDILRGFVTGLEISDSADTDIATRIDDLEQRVSALEGN